jgi:protein-tyrosine phosphatase
MNYRPNSSTHEGGGDKGSAIAILASAVIAVSSATPAAAAQAHDFKLHASQDGGTSRQLDLIPQLAASIPNFAAVTDGIYRGAAPSEDGLELLKKAGVKTIVDLRHYRHDWLREKSNANRLGLTYIHLPMGYARKPMIAELREFIGIVSDPVYQPVYIHCRQGADRTGALIAAYRIIKQNWPVSVTYKEMREHHFKVWQVPLKKTLRTCASARQLLLSSAYPCL